MPGQEEELRELRVFDISLHGKRGAVNGNYSVDRRHFRDILKKIQGNGNFIKNADRVSFEMELETIDGIISAFPNF
jgi:hypothetical protein